MQKLNSILVFFLTFTISVVSSAQILVEDAGSGMSPPPGQVAPRSTPTGKAAATEYFKKREESRAERAPDSDEGGSSALGEHFMTIHLGTFINDTAHRWGRQKKAEDPGEAIFGVTYRVGEWKGSMDLLFRGELISYSIDDENPLKLSLMPIVAFPDSRSTFPLYFGAGVGPGIFFKQAGDESDLSLDYAVLAGARFPGLFNNGSGLFFETGLKGHFHLLSNGQQRGVYLAGGVVFSF